MKKVLETTVDPKKREELKKSMQKAEKQTAKDVERKLASRRRTPQNIFTPKEPTLPTVDRVKNQLKTNEEYQMAKQAVPAAVEDTKKLYDLMNDRRRRYEARRRREQSATEAAVSAEMNDMGQRINEWKKRWEKAQAEAAAINPDTAQSKKVQSSVASAAP